MRKRTNAWKPLSMSLIAFLMAGSMQMKADTSYSQIADSQSVDPTSPVDVPVDPKPALTYQDVAPILASNCQSCHSNAADNGLGGISVDTEEEVLENASMVLTALETGWMPYEDPEWHKSEDGTKLINWLKSRIPVEPLPAPELGARAR